MFMRLRYGWCKVVRCSKTPPRFVSRLTDRDASEMQWLFKPLLLLVAKSTESELAKQVEYLKAENAILGKRIDKRLYLDPEVKRLLVKLGLAVGRGVTALLTVVSYPTFRRWIGLFAPESAGPSV